MSTQAKPFLTPEQYLEIERAAEFKSEYFNGEMFAMAGGSLNHAMIAGDLYGILYQQLRGKACKIAASDLRLEVCATGLYTYPDILIFCGEPKFADSRTDTITDATVIIEVLSPSTANYDRGFKFEQYRRIPSLKDYLVLAQDRVYLEHATRLGDDTWNLRETSDAETAIELRSIDCRFRVAEAYERMDLAA